jgi:hypothetical protein
MDPEGSNEEIRELSEGCRRFVRTALSIDLDETPDTLPLLDHYLMSLADRPSEEILSLIAPCAGAYFGELVLRHLPGARWHAPPGEHTRWRIEFSHCFLSFNPIGAALEASAGEAVAGWGAHFGVLEEDRVALKAALDRFQVREQDYFRLAIRYESLEQALATLAGRSAARLAKGEAPRFFSRAVYEAASLEEGVSSN